MASHLQLEESSSGETWQAEGCNPLFSVCLKSGDRGKVRSDINASVALMELKRSDCVGILLERTDVGRNHEKEYKDAVRR